MDLREIMKNLMDTVISYKDNEGRTLSDPFIKLPSRAECPDYYEIISTPIDIETINLKIDNGQYRQLDDLEYDFMLLCQNCQVYNEEGSLIHEDSIILQTIFLDIRSAIPENLLVRAPMDAEVMEAEDAIPPPTGDESMYNESD